MSRILPFALVGAAGFVADAGILALLLRATPLDPWSARVVSIAFALSLTWLLNRMVTFGPSARRLAAEGARYGGVGLASAALNYLVYCACLWLSPDMPVLAALVVASAVAMAFSFLGYSRLVFDR